MAAIKSVTNLRQKSTPENQRYAKAQFLWWCPGFLGLRKNDSVIINKLKTDNTDQQKK